MELLDVVDLDGNPTGEIVEREFAHSNGIRHRTSHVWLARNKDGILQILLQKRSRDKDSFPGCYDISSAGHIPAGCGYVESALRELKEELGVTAKAEDLICCGESKIGFDDVFHGKAFHDRQVSRVFIIWMDREESEFTVQKEEIESVLWMDLEECREAVKGGIIPNCINIEELNMIQRAVSEKK